MKKILFLVALLGTVGCKSADMGQITSLGSEFDISCYSGTTLILHTISQGQPSNEDHSDGFYFTDKESGKLVEVTGACIFKQR